MRIFGELPHEKANETSSRDGKLPMIGMLLIAIVFVWIGACAWMAQTVGNLFPARPWRRWLKLILCLILIPAPLIDEIIGGFQFRALCRENAVLRINEEKIKGKTIRELIAPSNKDIVGTAVRIYYSRFSFRDVLTDEELATYSRYVAEGGWLVRTIGMDAHMPPLIPMTLRDSSTCSPPERGSFPSKYGFTYQIKR